jgi:hypothetical protein
MWRWGLVEGWGGFFFLSVHPLIDIELDIYSTAHPKKTIYTKGAGSSKSRTTNAANFLLFKIVLDELYFIWHSKSGKYIYIARIHSPHTGVKATFKAGLKWGYK